MSLGIAVDMRLPTTFSTDVRIIAAVGLHALARRYERGARDDRAVLRDLTVFGRAWPEAVRSGGDFEVPALGDGIWRGTVMIVEGRPTMAVRTFVSDGLTALGSTETGLFSR